ncbi:MAG: hypothetical protein IIX11_05950, partial [Selenomonadales bacterium]|nr:hypothetical protein [Selenomonadales bacterium]
MRDNEENTSGTSMPENPTIDVPDVGPSVNEFESDTSTSETAVNGIYIRHGYNGLSGEFKNYIKYDENGYYVLNNMGDSS